MPHHPLIEPTIERIYQNGGVPMMHIDATLEGVVLPDFVKEQWSEHLLIALDPNDPLELTYTESGVSAYLAFRGFVQTCFFPWRSIWGVSVRGTQGIMLVPSHLPASVLAAVHGMPPPEPEPAPCGDATPDATPEPVEDPGTPTTIQKRGLRVIRGGKT